MKTFFNIEINIDGEHVVYKIKNTKLKKHSETRSYGVYIVNCDILPRDFRVRVYIHATYNVEMGGTVTKPIKQRRYTLRGYNYEVWQFDSKGMLHNQPKGLASVTVTLEESDVLPCNCTIKVNQR